VAYRLVRARREAQHYVAIYLDVTPDPSKVRAILTAKGLAQVAAGFLLALVTFEFGSETRLGGRLMMAQGLGKLTLTRPVGYITEMTTNAG
jgi:hypothetical protein